MIKKSCTIALTCYYYFIKSTNRSENDMKNLALELAQSMNVSVGDVMALAQSVANSIELDNVQSDQVNTDLVEAYVPHAVKKFNSFHSTYLTNPEARSAFQSSILADLTN